MYFKTTAIFLYHKTSAIASTSAPNKQDNCTLEKRQNQDRGMELEKRLVFAEN